MGFTKTGDPFVSGVPPLNMISSDSLQQVGPVVDPSADARKYDGQYISAGFSGHGMPRAFAWYIRRLSCRVCISYHDVCSAEAVAGMIASEILGQAWMLPQWLPKHYLTVSR